MAMRQKICILLSIVLTGVLASAALGASGQPVVQLDSGRIASFHWSVLASKGRGADGGARPCIVIALQEHPNASGGERSEACGPVSPEPNAQAFVNDIARPHIAVVAMAFASNVASVRLFLTGRPSRLYHLAPLSRSKASKAGLASFSYLADAFAGQFCLQRFVTYSDSGRVLDSGERMPCHHSDQARKG